MGPKGYEGLQRAMDKADVDVEIYPVPKEGDRVRFVTISADRRNTPAAAILNAIHNYIGKDEAKISGHPQHNIPVVLEHPLFGVVASTGNSVTLEDTNFRHSY